MQLLFRSDSYARRCTATVLSAEAGVGIRTDRTVFFATGGGQPGDSGLIRWNAGSAAVIDCVKGDGADDVVHLVPPGADLPAPGDTVELELDWDRRYRLMRMHTALHLLCAAVPGSVTGGQIAVDRSRLDFNVPAASLDKQAIEDRLNALVGADHEIVIGSITEAELEAAPELVRTLSVKPPVGSGTIRTIRIADVDFQPCGGTHVARTGEVGRIEVVKIENKGKQNRRVVIALVDDPAHAADG